MCPQSFEGIVLLPSVDAIEKPEVSLILDHLYVIYPSYPPKALLSYLWFLKFHNEVTWCGWIFICWAGSLVKFFNLETYNLLMLRNVLNQFFDNFSSSIFCFPSGNLTQIQSSENDLFSSLVNFPSLVIQFYFLRDCVNFIL